MIVQDKNKKQYEIVLPDGKKLRIWFIGSQLELLLDSYKIPYKRIKS